MHRVTRSVTCSALAAVALWVPSLLTADAAAKRRVVVVEEAEEGEDAAPARAPRMVTITIAPLSLIGPYFEGMVEVRLARQLGVALSGGGGKHLPSINGDGSAPFWHVGSQLKYYVMGSFENGGLQVGGDVTWQNAPKTIDASSAGANLALSPFVGWKWATPVGFTLDSQIGLSVLAVRQTNEEPGHDPKGNAKTVQLYTAFNLGWTF